MQFRLLFVIMMFLTIGLIEPKAKNAANSMFNKRKEECSKTHMCAGYPDNLLAQTCVYYCMSETCFRKKFIKSDGSIPDFGQSMKHQEQTFKQCWIDEHKSKA